MRPQLSNRVAVVLTWGVLALALVTMSARQSLAQCIDCAPVTNHFFGAAAAALGQTIRVNVSSYDTPDTFPAGATCTIGVNILGADGKSLLTATDSAPLQLPVGQTFFFDLNRNSLKVSGNRVLFRAVVSSIEDPNEIPNPCADIRATVEVYDNLTGRTQVFIGDPNLK
jgi:hypothetical protein